MKKYSVFILTLSLLFVNVSAQDKSVKVKRVPIDTTKFVLVEGGTFKMGTDKPVEKVEGPPHDVTIKSFYLAKTETTFDDFDKFCVATKRDTLSSNKWGRGRQPAIYVSWLDAVAYCNWLSETVKLSKYYIIKEKDVKTVDTAKGYRLPTEAEWEFAARGGNKSKGTTYAGTNDINTAAWYKDNSGDRSLAVAKKEPNELGLYDMNGNLWEWVWDWYDGNYYQTSPANNPQGPETGNYRVMRGGAFYNTANYARVYTRQNSFPHFKQNCIGVRVARTWFEEPVRKKTK